MRRKPLLSRSKLIISLLIVTLLAGLAGLIYINGYIGADTSQIFDKMTRDNQRRQDLLMLKNAIDGYYIAKGEFPVTDGWVEEKDWNAGVPADQLIRYKDLGKDYAWCIVNYPPERCPSNQALAETLLPLKLMAEIPRPPQASGYPSYYMYYRDDYCAGAKTSYGLYAKLEIPTQADNLSMQEGECSKANYDPSKNGMNYRLGGEASAIEQIDAANSLPQLSFAHNPENIISINGKIAFSYFPETLPFEFSAINQITLKKGWNSFTLPFLSKVKKNSAGAFSGLPTYRDKLRLYTWINSWKFLNEKSLQNLGEGYIIYSPSDQMVTLDNFENIIFYDDKAPIEIPLNFDASRKDDRWTLVGNPHFKTSPVTDWMVEYNKTRIKFEYAGNWIEIRYKDTFGVPVLEGGTEYKVVESVKPNQAFWVAAKLPGVKLIIK